MTLLFSCLQDYVCQKVKLILGLVNYVNLKCFISSYYTAYIVELLFIFISFLSMYIIIFLYIFLILFLT